MIIDAENKILGRIATVAAKNALLGETVNIVNCEKAVITGKKQSLIKSHLQKKGKGHLRGPFISILPDRFVRRTIRGMLPYKQSRGVNAFKRIRCFTGFPEKFQKQELFQNLKDISKLPNFQYLTVGEICRNIGGKK